MPLTLQLLAGGANAAGRETKEGEGDPPPTARVRPRPPLPTSSEPAKPATVSVRLLWRTTVRAGRRRTT